MTIAPAICTIVASHFEVAPDQITPDTRLDHILGADSLDWVEIVMEIEQATSADLFAINVEDMATVSDLIAATETALQAGGK